jgi:hypothetical protein
VPLFFFLCKSFPTVFHFFRLSSPLFADDFRYFWIGEAGMLGYDLPLVVLSI